MGEIARKLTNQINSIRMIKAEFDNSRSIGRRYARADEIGIPWAITVDHTTTEDLSVTIRRRDDQKQIRATIDDVIDSLTKGNLGSMF
jgi:glycyl-tRNA synthetase